MTGNISSNFYEIPSKSSKITPKKTVFPDFVRFRESFSENRCTMGNVLIDV